MKILGMDLGRSKSAWEILDTVTGEVARNMVKMDDSSLRKLLETRRPDRLVIESSPLAARVHDLAQSLGVAVVVADTTQDAWRWKNVKRKTDKDDANKLVRLELLGQINPVHMPTPAVRERRRLLEYRRRLVAEQTRCKNVIRAAWATIGLSASPGKNGWTLAQRQVLAEQSKPLADCGAEELWRGMVRVELTHLEQVEGAGRDGGSEARPVGAGRRARATTADDSRRRSANGGSDRGGVGRAAAVQEPAAGFGVRGSGSAAVSIGTDGSQRPDHEARQSVVAADALPGGVGRNTASARVPRFLPACGRFAQETAETGDRGVDAQDAGDGVGDVAG